jgi:Ni,Fe-hydrogenase III large subunit
MHADGKTRRVAVTAHAWREAVSAQLDAGAGFAGAWATGRPACAWQAAFAGPDGAIRVLSCTPEGGVVPSICDLVPAADWDEREAHDVQGLAFAGRESLRALVAHPDDLAAWTTPVEGDAIHQVAVGPIHAGVIESGHFRFHVVGERILAMDPRLFYKHRGLERAVEGAGASAGIAYAQRACAACAAANAVAYAQAVEDATGLEPDAALRRARTVLLELERLYNHLHDIGAICAGVGYAPGTMAFATLKDRAQRVNAALTGHRFLFGSVEVGGGRFAPGAAACDSAVGALRELRADAVAGWRELEFTGSVQARLDGVGVVTREDAQRLGASGPAARASGLRTDARTASPRLAYGDFAPAAPLEPTGDVAARVQVRAAELEATCGLLEELLAGGIEPGGCRRAGDPRTLGVGRVESPRGATLAAVELDGERIARMRLRTGSYANWPVLAHAVADNLLPDFPLINKSFELCYACVDR